MIEVTAWGRQDLACIGAQLAKMLTLPGCERCELVSMHDAPALELQDHGPTLKWT